MKKQALILAFCSTLLAPTVWAANHHFQTKGAVLTVQGQAEAMVQNDQAYIQFEAIEENQDAQVAQDKATVRMNQAIRALAPWKDRIVVKTDGFSTWPIYSNPKEGQSRQIVAWRANQSIRVLVKDLTILPRLTKTVGKTMTYSGINFQLSKEAQNKVNQKLTQDAIRDAQNKAVLAARTMGAKQPNIQIKSLQLGNFANSQPRYYALAASADAREMNQLKSAPRFEAGETKLHYQVTLEAAIQ